MSLSLPPIDVAFWESQNEFYSAERLTQNVQIGLRHAAKAGLIDSTAFATNRELVDAIAERIQAHYDAGASHVCIQPIDPEERSQPDWGLLEALAPSGS